ncbi:hypothetical protein BDZ89DRAFT_1053098 [Hymenopellis radicata]|nr:hypothetical protein BDZ89DRAFT_1053098 [Hymenopellis radicata]
MVTYCPTRVLVWKEQPTQGSAGIGRWAKINENTLNTADCPMEELGRRRSPQDARRRRTADEGDVHVLVSRFGMICRVLPAHVPEGWFFLCQRPRTKYDVAATSIVVNPLNADALGDVEKWEKFWDDAGFRGRKYDYSLWRGTTTSSSVESSPTKITLHPLRSRRAASEVQSCPQGSRGYGHVHFRPDLERHGIQGEGGWVCVEDDRV